ncbi:MAG: hypothetical protein Q7W56_11980 [Candidatus Latescibacteria bacterium]|nr:hypothetical protein [Candidatus Latescibacterota bacterium]
MHARITGALLIALVATTAVNAVGCPATLDVNANGGKAWLGMSAGGFIAGEGQSFHNECDGALYTVSFQVVLDGLAAGGVPPLGAGDTVYAQVRTLGGAVLATRSQVLNFSTGTSWITFDFTTPTLNLPAGDYLIACYTASAKQGRVAYFQNGDPYAGGVRYISETGEFGPWNALTPAYGDLAIMLTLEGEVVANEAATWGAVKAAYR